ncbi:hypothetical protein IB231_08315 [Pantoea sp. PNT02]|uniref:hypothetical protein n=1 Tax=Pantoea sp. PNT02 TaxID=2769261 RepID=UPI0017815310|nr:hypothetical protein [Pantoea sp. PNT02]MBD9643626.1 hypothetical protein [Pantoea sp. PNT02]
MKVISVDKKGLQSDFADWGVSSEYADFFIRKCDDRGHSVALSSFVFNDTMHLDNAFQWLSANAAFWCRAYREAEDTIEQVEALSAIRTLYFAAGFMGVSPVVALIRSWWSKTYELHSLPAPNHSQQNSRPTGFLSSLLNSSFLKH